MVHHRPNLDSPSRRGRATADGGRLFALAVLLVFGHACANPSLPGGATQVDEGRRDQAEALYRETLAGNPDDAQANLRLGLLLAEDGRAEEANRHLERAAASDPSLRPRVEDERRRQQQRYLGETRALLDQERLEEAAQRLKGAAVFARAGAETYTLQGRLDRARGDLEAAVEAFRQAVLLDAGSRERRAALAAAARALAERRYEEGRLAEARELLEESRRAEPDADLDYFIGTVAYAMARDESGGARDRHLEDAIAAFGAFLRRHPNDEDARFNLGAVLLAAGRYGEAADHYSILLVRNPRDGDLYAALARTHELAGRRALADAEEAIGRALRAGDPVEDRETWARKGAERYPGKDLAATYRSFGVPDEITTYAAGGGVLVEVWFYWSKGTVEAFRNGTRLGEAFSVPSR